MENVRAAAGTEPAAPEAGMNDTEDAMQSVAKIDLNKGRNVYKLNMAHQEVDRILKEVEENCELVIETAGREASPETPCYPLLE